MRKVITEVNNIDELVLKVIDIAQADCTEELDRLKKEWEDSNTRLIQNNEENNQRYNEVTKKRQELIEEIWGLENDSDYRTVDVHIKRIREKLEDITEFEIVTIRGIGYKAIIKNK